MSNGRPTAKVGHDPQNMPVNKGDRSRLADE
jgi:hypothetical protein